MTNPCQIHRTHNPSVATTVQLPPLPDFLMERLNREALPITKSWWRGRLWTCPTGKANIEAYTRYLLGEGDPLPVRVGTETKMLAQQAVSRYLSIVGHG